jgi:hypothetical protein
MTLFAILDGDRVAEFVSPEDGVEIHELEFLSKEQKAAAVAVPAGAHVGRGWTHDNGTFSPPAPAVPPAPPTPAQQARAMLAAGIAIACETAPELDGTYPVDVETRLDMHHELLSLHRDGVFADGGTTLDWRDTSGEPHTFTPPQFEAFAAVIGGTVRTLKQIVALGDGDLPMMPVEISHRSQNRESHDALDEQR